ncbi:helix-turn-helix domain-containing protein [Cereibacter sphaeroides]|uniref:helix-turn-helix domain-containing protein n=1 Tax=Cereibacter johrii TaxID=445629 RepID=UPI0010CA3074|nr:DNA-binding protein [Cereibacter sphaeroides]
MSARRSLTFAPRLLGAAEAAAYLGVSATTLRGLELPRRVLGGRRLYDRLDLDAFASDLPVEGEAFESEVELCDRHFGMQA